MRDIDGVFATKVHRIPQFFGFPVNFPVLREKVEHKKMGDIPFQIRCYIPGKKGSARVNPVK